MNEQEIKFLTPGDKLLPIVKTVCNGMNFKVIAYMLFCTIKESARGYLMLSVECFKHDNEGVWGVYTIRAKDVKLEKIDPDRYDIFECK